MLARLLGIYLFLFLLVYLIFWFCFVLFEQFLIVHVVVRSLSGERSGERTVKRLRLCKALTVPDSTTLHEACRRMAARRVDAWLLTNSNALLCGILTDRVIHFTTIFFSKYCLLFFRLNWSVPLYWLKDIATRVIAKELNLEETSVSKVMTKNPVFVLSNTIAVEALQKMVQGF